MANTKQAAGGRTARASKAQTPKARGSTGGDGNARTVSGIGRSVTKLINYLQEFQQQQKPTPAMEAWVKGSIPLAETLLEDCQQHQLEQAA